jgi:hypothetical protein
MPQRERTSTASPAWAVVALGDAAFGAQVLANAGSERILLVPFHLVLGAALLVEAVAAWRLVRGRRSGVVLRLALVPAVAVTALLGTLVVVTKLTAPSMVAVMAVLAFWGGAAAGLRVLRSS